jgi:hypothetical protein
MKASIGVLTHPESATAGGGISRTGWNAQYGPCERVTVVGPPPPPPPPALAHRAPASIQRRSNSTSAAERRGPLGGIASSRSSLAMRRIKSL